MMKTEKVCSYPPCTSSVVEKDKTKPSAWASSKHTECYNKNNTDLAAVKRKVEVGNPKDHICAIENCGKRAEVVDHIHGTEDFRGYLCGRHNIGLGHFHDNPKELIMAAKYLHGDTVWSADKYIT
jgi:hypothetical protein